MPKDGNFGNALQAASGGGHEGDRADTSRARSRILLFRKGD